MCASDLLQGKYDEAKLLFERAIEINKKALGHDHPDLATNLNNLAALLSAEVSVIRRKVGSVLLMPSVTLILQGKYLEALPVAQRAAAIFHKTLGPAHPHTQQTGAGVEQLESVARIVNSVTENQTNNARTELQQDGIGDASGQMMLCCW